MFIQSAIKASLWLVAGFGLAACAAAADPATQTAGPAGSTAIASTQTPIPPTSTSVPAGSLPDLGPAPDFTNEVWLNSDRPLDLASLRGKVILVEFWTFG